MSDKPILPTQCYVQFSFSTRIVYPITLVLSSISLFLLEGFEILIIAVLFLVGQEKNKYEDIDTPYRLHSHAYIPKQSEGADNC